VTPPARRPTAAEVEAFVAKVTGWSQLFEQCSNVAARRAHEQYAAGAIGLAEYDDVVQQSLALLQRTAAMNQDASEVLLKVAEQQLAPLEQAAGALALASAKLEQIQDVVTVAAELFAAVAAVSVAVGAPSPASIAAAGAAVGGVAKKIAGQAGG
jgi:hypothetical protein